MRHERDASGTRRPHRCLRPRLPHGVAPRCRLLRHPGPRRLPRPAARVAVGPAAPDGADRGRGGVRRADTAHGEVLGRPPLLAARTGPARRAAGRRLHGPAALGPLGAGHHVGERPHRPAPARAAHERPLPAGPPPHLHRHARPDHRRDAGLRLRRVDRLPDRRGPLAAAPGPGRGRPDGGRVRGRLRRLPAACPGAPAGHTPRRPGTTGRRRRRPAVAGQRSRQAPRCGCRPRPVAARCPRGRAGPPE
ncbi:hypothetical protein SGPA1_20657 [Streptomyces misionensis JCM 4497]